MRAILPADADGAMPPKGDRLKKPATDILKDWIAQGAEWPENLVLTARKLEAAVVDQSQIDADIRQKILAHLTVTTEARGALASGSRKRTVKKYGATVLTSKCRSLPCGDRCSPSMTNPAL